MYCGGDYTPVKYVGVDSILTAAADCHDVHTVQLQGAPLPQQAMPNQPL